MIPPEMYVWFGAALIMAGITFILLTKITDPPPYRFEAPEDYKRFQPARAYNGRHRKPEEEREYGYHPRP